MSIARILSELTSFTALPAGAIRAATARRETITPVFIETIKQFATHQNGGRPEASPLFLIFHLLGSWREKSAYRPLVQLLRRPPDEIEPILGDAVTATSHRVMAAVFDGDPLPLYEVILDPAADEYLRSRMCDALAIVTLRGEMERSRTNEFLRDCFTQLRPQTDNHVWAGWQSAIAVLGLVELHALVEQAFVRGSIDPQWTTFAHFETELKWAMTHPGESPSNDYTLFGDIIEELSHWDRFSER